MKDIMIQQILLYYESKVDKFGLIRKYKYSC